MSSALVVIDVQNHFAVEKAVDLPGKIANHIKKSPYDYVLFTLYRNDPNSNFHKILKYEKATTSPGIDLHPVLLPFSNKDNTFEKLTYSAFKIQQFKKFLEDNAVTDLFLCGINIDGCVLATAFEAFDLGYNVKILEDLSSVASFRQDYEDSAKTIIARNLKPRTAKEKQFGDILDLIRQNPGIRPSEINSKLRLDHSAPIRDSLIKQRLVRKVKTGNTNKYYPVY